jgi:hypothetical protein
LRALAVLDEQNLNIYSQMPLDDLATLPYTDLMYTIRDADCQPLSPEANHDRKPFRPAIRPNPRSP